MFRRVSLTFAELSLWFALMAVVVSGCATSVANDPPRYTANKPMISTLEETQLIPREVLFGNPFRAQARLSPDGRWLSFLAPVKQASGAEVLNIWVAPIDSPEKATPVTQDTLRGIRGHSWTYSPDVLVYSQDKGGDENWHVYATNVATKKTIDLTPIEGVNAEILADSNKHPNTLLVGLNDRDPQLHDVYQVDVRTAQRKLVQQNPGVAGFVTDDSLAVRLALNYTPTGGQVWLLPEGAPGETGYGDWKTIEEFGPEDSLTSGPAGYTADGRTFYFQDSRKRNTSGLFAADTKTGAVKLIAEDPRADAGGVLSHPVTHTLQAVSFTYARRQWQILDDSVRADIDFLTKYQDGEFEVTGRTLDDTQWSVAYILDNGPVKFYRYQRPAAGGAGGERKMTYLFSSRDDLDKYPLVKMHDREIATRDGLKLVCYLTLPAHVDPDNDGVPSQPVPMVLDVHGGPWARDGWGFNSEHQWLANRGYAVLSVNYRGSTGFGKEFINAANGEWAGKMHDDLLDAVAWAEENKIAQPDKICIMGGSYGGYATLVGLTFTPERFTCGVDVVGPSSLVTLIENVPPYWAPFLPVMKLRVGDWTTEAGKAELLRRSPLTRVDKIQRPLLIGQGANDPRVTQQEADQIVEAMQTKSIPVTYVLYPDEGHGFARPENRMSFNAVTEAFLAQHLGGRYEPIGEGFQGSSITVPAGDEGVPGLPEALADRPPASDDSAKPN